LHRSSTIPAGEIGVLTEIDHVSIYRRDAGSRPVAVGREWQVSDFWL
jgi:hypothetical protein